MGLVKERLDAQKLRGGYYTPTEIAKFLCKWAITKKTNSILEPSCGDGNFIEEALVAFNNLGIKGESLVGRVKGIELIEEESLKSKSRTLKYGEDSARIINSDFFNYINNNGTEKYDVILGNPPFIRYQSFPKEHREIAMSMMRNLGLKPNKLTNIWTPFLVVSASLLKSQGKLAMVIPAELFQVKYAAETRVFLSKFFDRITIITFKRLVFKNIQQEVVLLLCEKRVDSDKGIRVIECENLEDLDSIDFNKINKTSLKPVDHSTEKWTKYFLSKREINLLKKLKSDKRIIRCGDILDVDVGLVTGRNEFFMMKQSQVSKWKLEKYTIPVVSKSNQLRGIEFSHEDFKQNSDDDYSVHLFIPPNEEFDKLPKECKEYIKYGESKDFHTGYKCRIRKRWYITPSLWSPDGFALRQVSYYPKLSVNKTNSSSTDTIHRVRFKENTDARLATISFMNSLSFAFSEITGRSYGGGVMTFEPTEIEDIRIPKLINLDLDFDKIDNLIRNREIDKVLDIVDQEFLIKGHGFSLEQVNSLRKIWVKLSNRRLIRNKSKK